MRATSRSSSSATSTSSDVQAAGRAISRRACRATNRRETAVTSGIRPPAGVVERQLGKGLDPRSQVSVVFTGPFENDQANRDHRARDGRKRSRAACSGRCARISAAPTASAHGRQFTERPSNEYRVTIEFACDPARMDALVTSLFRVVDQFRELGPSRAQTSDVRAALIRDLETNSRDNAYLLNQLTYKYQYGEDPAEAFNLEKFYDQITPAAIQKAAQTYLDTKRYVKVTLVPAAGARARSGRSANREWRSQVKGPSLTRSPIRHFTIRGASRIVCAARLEPIADVADRLDVDRAVRVRLDLAAQRRHAPVDAARRHEHTACPTRRSGSRRATARSRAARRSTPAARTPSPSGRRPRRRARHAPRGQIDLAIPEPSRRSPAARRRRRNARDPRDQLADPERLGDVVVGAEVEAEDDVLLPDPSPSASGSARRVPARAPPGRSRSR